MIDEELNKKDLDFILESLKYTKLKFENYDQYPDYSYKQKRVEEVSKVITKVKKLKQSFREF